MELYFGAFKSQRPTGNTARVRAIESALCALAHNLVLVSNNIRHFSRIEGLRIENWAEEV